MVPKSNVAVLLAGTGPLHRFSIVEETKLPSIPLKTSNLNHRLIEVLLESVSFTTPSSRFLVTVELSGQLLHKSLPNKEAEITVKSLDVQLVFEGGKVWACRLFSDRRKKDAAITRNQTFNKRRPLK